MNGAAISHTHLSIDIDNRLSSTSITLVVQILLVFQGEDSFGKLAHGAEHVLINELVQDFHQVVDRMISVDNSLALLGIILGLGSELISKILGITDPSPLLPLANKNKVCEGRRPRPRHSPEQS